jgi:hypothetical protein
LDFRLLGPLEVVGDGGVAVSIGSGRQRALLALLILRANELVASDRLVEELWGDSPPPTVQRMLHNQVSALRRALGQNGRLETHGSAYRLSIHSGETDEPRPLGRSCSPDSVVAGALALAQRRKPARARADRRTGGSRHATHSAHDFPAMEPTTRAHRPARSSESEREKHRKSAILASPRNPCTRQLARRFFDLVS